MQSMTMRATKIISIWVLFFVMLQCAVECRGEQPGNEASTCQMIAGGIEIEGKVAQTTFDGILCDTLAARTGGPKTQASTQLVLIYDTSLHAIGDDYKAIVFPAGEYKYVASGVEAIIVPAYSPDETFAFRKLHPAQPESISVQAPLGFLWEFPEHLFIKALRKVEAAKVTSIEKEGGQQSYYVTGLALDDDCTVFKFYQSKLIAVTLVYNHPDWSQGKFKTHIERLQENFRKRYGEGKESEEDDTRVMAWVKARTSVTILTVHGAKNSDIKSMKVEYKIN